MKNPYAVAVNSALGVQIYNETNIKRLEVIKYNKKEIQKLMIDDLVLPQGEGTDRLVRFTRDILFRKSVKNERTI